MRYAKPMIDVDYQPPHVAPVRMKPELTLVTSDPEARELRPIRRVPRAAMSEAETLLQNLLEGTLLASDYGRVIPFHCVDERYKKCAGFMRRFYLLGYGGFSPGPSIGAFGDGIATLCFLTADGPSLGSGMPIAAVIGEHEDCGFSKLESGSQKLNVVEKRTVERTDSHLTALFSRKDIAPALRTGRLSVVITRSAFLREGDGSYSVAYRIMPERTNALLQRSDQPELSKEFSVRFAECVMRFGQWGAREKKAA